MTQPAHVKHGLRALARAIRYAVPAEAVAVVVEPPPPPPPPPPGPLLFFQQTDLLTDYIDNPACSGLVAGGDTENIRLLESGTPGVRPRSFVVNTETNRAHIYMETGVNEPGVVEWLAGTWLVRVNITGHAGVNARIQRCHICRIDSAGVNKETIGSRLGLNISCTFGLKSWTVTCSASSGALSDRIQLIIGMNRLGFSGVTVEVTPNQVLDTPIRKAA